MQNQPMQVGKFGAFDHVNEFALAGIIHYAVTCRGANYDSTKA